MSGFTKEQWEEFCGRLGIDPKQALKSGKADLGTKKTQRERTTAKKTKSAPSSGVSHSLGKQDPNVALETPVARTQPLLAHPGSSPRVRIIVRGCRVRFLDPDNFIAGCKSIVDGIITAGIAANDSQQAIEAGELRIDYEQQLVTAYTKECTEIEIEWNDPDVP